MENEGKDYHNGIVIRATAYFICAVLAQFIPYLILKSHSERL